MITTGERHSEMRYPHQIFRYSCVIFLMGVLGLANSAFAGGISTSSPGHQRLASVSKLGWSGARWLRADSTTADAGWGVPHCPLAYVDPGSGQLIWQMLLAGCVGALFYVKRVRDFLTRQLTKWFKKKE